MEIGEQMTAKTICVLSDSCAAPVMSAIKKFRGDFEKLIPKKQATVAVAAD
jgi:NADH-quinone oxidoreductase subunit F